MRVTGKDYNGVKRKQEKEMEHEETIKALLFDKGCCIARNTMLIIKWARFIYLFIHSIFATIFGGVCLQWNY